MIPARLRSASYSIGSLFLLLCSISSAQSPQNSSGSTSNNPAAPVASLPPDGNFFERLGEAYWTDWSPALTPPPASAEPSTASPTNPAVNEPSAPVRRGYPALLDSPPFPGFDYSVGGTPVIGAPDTQTYILMQAIDENKGRTKIYGWLNGGFDVSTSNRGDGANSPAAYYYNPNRLIPDQEVLYIERLPNSVQTDHVD